MNHKTRLSYLSYISILISCILALSLVFSGSFTSLAFAVDSNKNTTTEEIYTSSTNDKHEVYTEDINLDTDALEATSSIATQSANESDDLPELKENSWRYEDGKRIDTDLNIMPQLQGIYDHGNIKGRGIDVSAWQGNINWTAVKGNVDFVIIRAGYGGNAYQYDDTKWARNVDACERYGIPYGVYLYSYATSIEDANSEVDHTLRLLSGHRPSYPVYLDMEDKSTIGVGNGMLAQIGVTFCERIKSAGYTPGVYANLNWWRNYLTDSRFDNYERWVAQYNYRCDYEGDYRIWQYSSSGSVPGIDGNVDMNYDYGEITESQYELVYNYQFYRNAYSDLRNAYGDNRGAYFRHFIRFGMSEGRQGSPLLNPGEYKNRYSDLIAEYGDNMPSYYTHFMNYGWQEGRMPCNNFDVVSYYNANNDIRNAFGRNIYQYYVHYNNFGYFEGRSAVNVNYIVGANTVFAGTNWSAVYDYAYYVSKNGDIKSAYTFMNLKGGPLIDDSAVIQHFYYCGMFEGRRGNSSFDIKGYYNSYLDLRMAYGRNTRAYFLHYCDWGRYEGRTSNKDTQLAYRTDLDGMNYSSIYNGTYYAEHNGDVRDAYTFNLTNADKVVDDGLVLRHFVNFGMSERRQPSSWFNVNAYRSRYGDLQAAYGNNWKNYYLHYIYYGINENRTAI